MSSRLPAIVFVILACGITWIAEMPDAVRRFYPISFHFPQSVYSVCLFGPAIAAVVASIAFEGVDGLRQLAATFRFRVSLSWYGFALLVPFATLGVVVAGMAIAGAPVPSHDAWGMAFALTFWWLPLFLREELGWRGYFLPLLLRTQPPLRATAWTTLVWAAWHIPLYVASASIGYALLVLVLIVPISVFFTLIFLRTKSVVVCTLFHSAIDCGSAQLLFFTLGKDYKPALAEWILLLYLLAVPAMRALSREQKEQPNKSPETNALLGQ